MTLDYSRENFECRVKYALKCIIPVHLSAVIDIAVILVVYVNYKNIIHKERFRDMELNKLFLNHPEMLDDRKKLKGVFADFYFNKNSVVNRMMIAYEAGIVQILLLDFDLQYKKNVLLTKLIDEYSMKETVAQNTIDQWCEICDEKVIKEYKRYLSLKKEFQFSEQHDAIKIGDEDFVVNVNEDMRYRGSIKLKKQQTISYIILCTFIIFILATMLMFFFINKNINTIRTMYEDIQIYQNKDELVYVPNNNKEELLDSYIEDSYVEDSDDKQQEESNLHEMMDNTENEVISSISTSEIDNNAATEYIHDESLVENGNIFCDRDDIAVEFLKSEIANMNGERLKMYFTITNKSEAEMNLKVQDRHFINDIGIPGSGTLGFDLPKGKSAQIYVSWNMEFLSMSNLTIDDIKTVDITVRVGDETGYNDSYIHMKNVKLQ